MHNVTKFILFFLLACTDASYAGGPINLGGPTGNTPVIYQNSNIDIHVENGDFGLTPNAAAVVKMQDAFNLWNNVITSAINLNINTSLLNFEVDVSNYLNYVDSLNGPVLHANDLTNPFIFDSNGAITNQYFGLTQNETILGFSGSSFFGSTNSYAEGFSVINASAIETANVAAIPIFAHEIGHFIGLDHSQVNIDNQESVGFPGFCTTTTSNNYPLMYPFACRSSSSLHADDISAVSALYPAVNINNNFGILNGRFLDDAGNAILGANIWAENTTGDIISGISDYLKQNTGFFQLYLPAGNYTLHANSINTAFEGGSGVGPYSDNSADASFIAPHPITEVVYQGNTAPNAEVITISTNQTITINFSNTGAKITLATNNGTGGSDNIFGATSHLTLLLLLSGLLYGRRMARY